MCRVSWGSCCFGGRRRQCAQAAITPQTWWWSRRLVIPRRNAFHWRAYSIHFLASLLPLLPLLFFRTSDRSASDFRSANSTTSWRTCRHEHPTPVHHDRSCFRHRHPRPHAYLDTQTSPSWPRYVFHTPRPIFSAFLVTVPVSTRTLVAVISVSGLYLLYSCSSSARSFSDDRVSFR